jgi:hypothetical protein
METTKPSRPKPGTSPMKRILPTLVVSLLIFTSSNLSALATTIKYVTFHYSGQVTSSDEPSIAVGDPFSLTLSLAKNLPPGDYPPCQDDLGEHCYLFWEATVGSSLLLDYEWWNTNSFTIYPGRVLSVAAEAGGGVDLDFTFYFLTAEFRPGGLLNFTGVFPNEIVTGFTATATATPTPESGTTLALLASGLIALGALARRIRIA